MYIETHCHLDMLRDEPLEAYLEKASQANIEKIITIAVEPSNLSTVIEFANKYSQVYCSQGVHPHDAKSFNSDVGKTIRDNASKEGRVLAIGEIGLDYHYDKSPRDKQKEAFEAQLQIATDLDLPVIIHSRDADEDMMAILKNFAPRMRRKGVIHSFTSEKKLAELALSLDFYLGFNGIITFKNAQNVRDIVALTPQEKILYETDSPFLTPVPYRGKPNGPHLLPYIAAKVAEIKNQDSTILAAQVYKNSVALFNF